jgi:hypothetical protein
MLDRLPRDGFPEIAEARNAHPLYRGCPVLWVPHPSFRVLLPCEKRVGILTSTRAASVYLRMPSLPITVL